MVVESEYSLDVRIGGHGWFLGKGCTDELGTRQRHCGQAVAHSNTVVELLMGQSEGCRCSMCG